IEADADPLTARPVGWHFVAQPALEEQDGACLGGEYHPRPVLTCSIREPRGSRHHSLEPRVFDLQPRTAPRSLEVVSTADGGERVQVQAVRRTARHDVDP